MTCDELSGEHELYMMGVCEEPERSELLDHLARNCRICVPEMHRAAELVAGFTLSANSVEPPVRLRKRVLASVGAEAVPEKGRGWLRTWVAATVCTTVVLGGLFMRTRDEAATLARDLSEARREVALRNVELARAGEVLAILNSPETIVRVSAEGAARPPQGKVFLNPARGVLLIASNLPPAPAGKIYEMWVIPVGGKPVPAGLFQPEPNGTALHFLRGSLNVASTAAIAVTLEAAGGAAQPTTTPIIVAPLKRG
ncbi:MAG: anti-sigma factor [Bryobacteraceae bacterium]